MFNSLYLSFRTKIIWSPYVCLLIPWVLLKFIAKIDIILKVLSSFYCILIDKIDGIAFAKVKS